MRLSRLVMLPFAIAVGYILYHMLVLDQYGWSYYLIPPVIIIAACLSLYPQIDALGYKWWPPKVDEKLKKIFHQSSPSFDWIPTEQQDDFIIRLVTYCRKHDFTGMKVEDIPTDVQAMCLYPGLLLDDLFGTHLVQHINRTVLYKHPFPSPLHKDWHSAELHYEDGVILYSLEQLMISYMSPDQRYHIGFDPWIRGLIQQKPNILPDQNLHSIDPPLWQNESAENFLGLTDIPVEVQHLYCFLIKNNDYQAQFPDLHDHWLQHCRYKEFGQV